MNADLLLDVAYLLIILSLFAVIGLAIDEGQRAWKKRKSRRLIRAIHRSAKHAHALYGDGLIDAVHEEWDPVDAQGPRRNTGKWR